MWRCCDCVECSRVRWAIRVNCRGIYSLNFWRVFFCDGCEFVWLCCGNMFLSDCCCFIMWCNLVWYFLCIVGTWTGDLLLWWRCDWWIFWGFFYWCCWYLWCLKIWMWCLVLICVWFFWIIWVYCWCGIIFRTITRRRTNSFNSSETVC